MISEIAREMMTDLFLPFPVSPSMDSFMEERTPERPIDRAELFRLALQPGTVRTVKHEFPRTVASSPIPVGTWYELARLPSNWGEITTLRHIEIYQSDSYLWGLSDHVATRLYEGLNCRYYLIYTQKNPPLPQNRIVIPAAYLTPQIYGTFLFELPEWFDQRFHAGNEIDLQIPLKPGYNLSLFMRIDGISFIPVTWVTGVTYVRGDIVFHSGAWYICCVENVSADPATRPDLSVNIWRLIADGRGVFSGWRGTLTATVQSERHLASMLNSARSAY